MTEPDHDPVVELDEVRHRYVIRVGGEAAGFAQFFDHGTQRVFVHTEIDEAYAGRGLATRLVRAALDDVRAAGRRVVAICPFVKAYVERHHDYDDLVDPVTPELLGRRGGA